MSFDNISRQYKEKSLVQQKAALKLLNLLAIKGNDNVLDVGCGPGHITNKIKEITMGRIIGIDISEGMIRQGKTSYSNIEFRHIAAEDLDYDNEFEIVFCNSTFPWFKDPTKAVRVMFNSLKKSGRIGISCPVTLNWAPCFDRLISKVVENENIRPTFSHWKSPWIFLPTKNDYKYFFEKQGFSTLLLNVEYEQTYYPTEDAYNIYLSSIANGYTIKQYYDIDIDNYYIEEFNNLVKKEIEIQSKDGKINVDFNRMYYIGKKYE